MKKMKKAEIKVSRAKAAYIRKVLSGEEPFGEDEQFSVTAKFEDGYEVDVKLCGVDFRDETDSPWTEAVLFRNGAEVSCSEVGEEFFGEWRLYSGGDEFIVNVVEE